MQNCDDMRTQPLDLDRLMCEYGTQLLRLCTLYLKDCALAEDAVQDTFLKAWKAGVCDPEGEKAWLTRIAVNTCKSYLRSPWLGRRVDAKILESLTVEDGSNADDTLPRAIMSLPRKYREVILLYYYQGFRLREISDILLISPETAATRLSRARAKLKPLLKSSGIKSRGK